MTRKALKALTQQDMHINFYRMPMSIVTKITVRYKERGIQPGRSLELEAELGSFVSHIEDQFPSEIFLQAMSVKAGHEICI